MPSTTTSLHYHVIAPTLSLALSLALEIRATWGNFRYLILFKGTQFLSIRSELHSIASDFMVSVFIVEYFK